MAAPPSPPHHCPRPIWQHPPSAHHSSLQTANHGAVSCTRRRQARQLCGRVQWGLGLRQVCSVFPHYHLAHSASAAARDSG
ncbi:hypothetical protein FKM82_004504 [Ascaphus truei]